MELLGSAVFQVMNTLHCQLVDTMAEHIAHQLLDCSRYSGPPPLLLLPSPFPPSPLHFIPPPPPTSPLSPLPPPPPPHTSPSLECMLIMADDCVANRRILMSVHLSVCRFTKPLKKLVRRVLKCVRNGQDDQLDLLRLLQIEGGGCGECTPPHTEEEVEQWTQALQGMVEVWGEEEGRMICGGGEGRVMCEGGEGRVMWEGVEGRMMWEGGEGRMMCEGGEGRVMCDGGEGRVMCEGGEGRMMCEGGEGRVMCDGGEGRMMCGE